MLSTLDDHCGKEIYQAAVEDLLEERLDGSLFQSALDYTLTRLRSMLIHEYLNSTSKGLQLPIYEKGYSRHILASENCLESLQQ